MKIVAYTTKATDTGHPVFESPEPGGKSLLEESARVGGAVIVERLAEAPEHASLPPGRRPRLGHALLALADARADVLWVDRLECLGDVQQQEIVLAWAWEHGAQVWPNPMSDRAPAEDRVRNFIRDAMAEAVGFSRALESLRLMEMLEPPADPPPLTLHDAYNRAKKMREQGATWQSIADTLNREGYKTARNKKWWPASCQNLVDGMPPR
ncbi:MAG: hypothetical protein WCD35_18430 [Mycobacteriales bacterium]